MSCKNLNTARSVRNDEFYTRFNDVRLELEHYAGQFAGKIVYCNCDSISSAFWHYFHKHFAELGLNRLVATCYGREACTAVYNGGDDDDTMVFDRIKLSSDGDFRSPECIEILKSCDIVVTNPPFSLFREYIAQLVEYDKKFLIIGSKNAVTYKEVFPLIRDNKIWLGCNNVKEFLQPDASVKKFGNIGWFTNLDVKKRHEKLVLDKCYSRLMYPTFDNYEGISVGRVKDIPCDYDGIMGVPVTYLEKHNPEQFKILGITCRNYSPEYRKKFYDKADYSNANTLNGSACVLVNGEPKMLYCRLLIKRI